VTASAILRETVQVTAGLVGRDVLIRPYTAGDEPVVIALWQAALADAAPHNDPALAIQKKREAGGDLFLVAEVSGTVVGTVMGGYDGHRGWVYALAVAASYRRQGIGRALVRHLEAALADRGCLKVNLQVRASNAAVVGFYQAVGYGVEERVSMGKRLY
jgi:ribosomal protein S18 acetylase RimI-like enzyme